MPQLSRPVLAEAAAASLVALVTAAGLAFVVHTFCPWGDPVDVVGQPIVSGHSERAEQLAFYTFFLACGAVSLGAAGVLRRLRPAPLSSGGLLAVAAIPLLPLCFLVPVGLLLVLVSAALAVGAGRISVHRHPGLPGLRGWFPWAVGGLLLYRGYLAGTVSWLLSVLFTPLLLIETLLAVILLAVVLKHWGGRLVSTAHRWRVGLVNHVRRRPWPALGLGLAALLALFEVYELVLALVGFVCAEFGRRLGKRPAGPHAGLYGPQWIVGAFALASAFLFVNWVYSPIYHQIHRPEWPYVTALIGFGALARLRFGPFELPRPDQPWLSRLRWRTAGPALLVGSAAAVMLRHPWHGLLMTLLIGLLMYGRRLGRPRLSLALLAAGFLMLAFLPQVAPRSGVDRFHDGQIVSAVWEFETGRALYSEVFPLRGFHFFVCWLSRQVLPPTLEAFHAGYSLIGFLPVGGAFLLTFAWTRSLLWSLATGVAVGIAGRLDPRQGMHLWIAAMSLELLRMRGSRHWILFAVPGCLAGFAGFDALVPLVASATAAVFLVPALRPPATRSGFRGHRRLTAAAAVFLIPTGAFTLAVVLWQGFEPAATYWRLLVDYARHFNAFCGLPVPWDIPAGRKVAVGSLLILGLWTAGGTWALGGMRDRRRRMWVFLSLFVFLLMHRGLGRSAISYMESAVYPVTVLASLGLFEAVRLIRREFRNVQWLDRRGIAAVSAVLFLWQVPYTPSNPFEIAGVLRSLPPDEELLDRQDPFVLRQVSPNETFWPIDNGIATYIHRRHNPTRHAIAYAMSTPREQRLAVRAMRKRPPALVEFPSIPPVDGIPTPLRYYILSQYLFENYKPSSRPGYLVPAGESWNGTADLPSKYHIELDLRRLPREWASRRLPTLDNRIISRRAGPTGPGTGSTSPEHAASTGGPAAPGGSGRGALRARDKAGLHSRQSDRGAGRGIVRLPDRHRRNRFGPLNPHSPQWVIRDRVNPRRFNYLVMRLACEPAQSSGRDGRPRPGSRELVPIRLDFASPERGYHPRDAVTFEAAVGETPKTYLIPVGCSPGWSWRPVIGRMRLSVPSGYRLSKPRLELLEVDEVSLVGG